MSVYQNEGKGEGWRGVQLPSVGIIIFLARLIKVIHQHNFVTNGEIVAEWSYNIVEVWKKLVSMGMGYSLVKIVSGGQSREDGNGHLNGLPRLWSFRPLLCSSIFYISFVVTNCDLAVTRRFFIIIFKTHSKTDSISQPMEWAKMADTLSLLLSILYLFYKNRTQPITTRVIIFITKSLIILTYQIAFLLPSFFSQCPKPLQR